MKETIIIYEVPMDIYLEAEVILAQEPLITTTMDKLPEQLRSMVNAALIVAYVYGSIRRGKRRSDTGRDN